MATVFDVAQYILGKTGKISTMKLQKLCYYSQAWALAWTEKPLFSELFQAWVNGPVCPDLFQLYKGKFMVTSSDLLKGDAAALTPDQVSTIDKVLDHYSSWEPYELREQTHSENPWKDARQGLADDEPSDKEITQSSMGEYYGNL